MSSCEKCYRKAQRIATHSARDFNEIYHDLLNSMLCTPEEQAGPDATICQACGRKTEHQHTGLCQVPGCHKGKYK